MACAEAKFLVSMAVFRDRHWCFGVVFCKYLTMQTTLAFGIHTPGVSIRIENTCPEVHGDVERYVLPPFPRNGACPSPQDVVLKIDRVDGQYLLTVDDAEAGATSDRAELLLAILKAIDDTVIHRLPTLKAVHAGAVVFASQAILIPGITHAGKSSMVAELLRRGAKLLSDEYALIDKDGLVHSYPRPLLLRDSRLQQSPVLPQELGSEFAQEPVPIGLILALEYRNSSAWDIREVTQSEALMILLRNTPHPLAESPEMVNSFVHAVSRARCFVGSRGDAAQDADQILQLIGAPA